MRGNAKVAAMLLLSSMRFDMRAMLCAALAVGLLSLASAPAWADNDADLKGLIEKAVAANGGKENSRSTRLSR